MRFGHRNYPDNKIDTSTYLKAGKQSGYYKIQFELTDEFGFTTDAEVQFAFRVINPYNTDYSDLELLSTTDFPF